MTDGPIRNICWQDKTATVEVAGDIDLHRSSALQRGLLGVLDENPRRVIVNLSAVPYMDSSGVASLVKLLSRTRKLGVDLSLTGLTDKVRSIFEITRLDSVFNIAETEQEAPN